MKKTLLQLTVALGILLAGVSAYLLPKPLWLPFEYKIKDMMLKARGEIQGDERIVIIDIDEKSLKALGQWPWSRDKVARVLQNLSDMGAAIIGMDVVFAEADNSSPRYVLKQLGIKADDFPDYDAILAKTVEETPTIVGYAFSLLPDMIAPEGQPKTASIIIERNKPASSYLIKPYRPILNLASIQKSAYSNGYFNTIPDNDGIVRSIPLVMDYNGILYPSLSLEMVRILLEEKKIEVFYDERGVSHIALGEHIIPTDFFGRMMINYRGGQNKYRYISAIDVFNKSADSSYINGKIALLGTSAAGLLDLRSTPFESVYAGVEVHANAIDNILHQDFIAKPVWARGVDVMSIIALVLVTFFVLLIPNALLSFTCLILINGLIAWTHYFIMIYEGVLLNTVLPLLSVNLLFIVGQALNYSLETKQKELIKHKFASKVSPAVMNDLLASEGDILDGVEKEITIFFSDIRHFTAISEAAGNPKHLIHLLNAYMNPMTEIIIRNEGTVDKFIGDAIMAYWNAPLSIENHADKALKAALEQLRHLKALNASLQSNPEFATIAAMSEANAKPIIDIGIGINTGLAIVGEMGTLTRSDYTVIGDAINLGSRLESLCKYYGARLIISEFTKNKLKEEYLLRSLDLVRVKGKSEPVEIWQVHDYVQSDQESLLAQSVEKTREELALHHEAIAYYRQARFHEALALFDALRQKEETSNETIYAIYCERCLHYIEFPPSDFDGVFTHTAKG
jgi:adenylate cyclase